MFFKLNFISTIIIIIFNFLNASSQSYKHVNPVDIGLMVLNQDSEEDMIQICKSIGFVQKSSSSSNSGKIEFASSDGLTVQFTYSPENPCVKIYPVKSIKSIIQDLRRLHFKQIKSSDTKEQFYINGTIFSSTRTECRISAKTIYFVKKYVLID